MTEAEVMEALRTGAKYETDLAARYKLPRARVHAVCLDLEKRGLIGKDMQRPIKWRLSIEGLRLAQLEAELDMVRGKPAPDPALTCKHCGGALPRDPDITEHFQEGRRGAGGKVTVTRRGIIEKRRCPACHHWTRTEVPLHLPAAVPDPIQREEGE